MSEFKTDKIRPVDAGGTTTLGESGDTIATGSGTTLNIQGTYSGINSINWDTTAKTANFTAETNKGYFINTTSGGVTITLPATPVAGSFIGIKDYALTAQTNNIIIAPNGNKIQGSTNNFLINTQGGSANLVYVDATQGWLTFDAAQASDISENATFIVATGGTITTCGNDKIHTFTGPGTFCVTSIGNPAGGGDTVDYLVVAGGGSGGAGNFTNSGTGGGGAGGYRTSGYGPAPLQGSALPVTATGFPITVGGGGAGQTPSASGAQGNNSVFSTITSTGGGGGAGPSSASTAGGSGGGSQNGSAVGAGNTPPVSPPQGNAGGASGVCAGPNYGGGGGGGAIAVGGTGSGSGGGAGGAGAPNAISGSATAYAGGGGGGAYCSGTAGGSSPCGTGGQGSSGPGGQTGGATNTGGGGGGSNDGPGGSPSGSGGSGIVIIRYRYQ